MKREEMDAAIIGSIPDDDFRVPDDDDRRIFIAGMRAAARCAGPNDEATILAIADELSDA